MKTLWDKDDRTIQEAFYAFCAAHPEALQMFRQFAEQWRAAGHSKCSAKMLCEVMRWEHGVQKPDGEDFAINNTYVSRMVRLLIEEDPTFETFFELRRTKAA